MTTHTLSKYSSGNVKELLLLSSPIFLSLLSSNLMLFCNRFFLSRFSLDAFNAVGVAYHLIVLFQITSLKFTSINQVFIGRALGEKSVQNIGPYTWQMIWGSFLTFFFTFPISFIAGELYFADTKVMMLGKTYFSIMMLGNFLYPLGAALAAFQIGLGKTKIIFFVTLFANLLNILLDYFLINGVTNLFNPLGVKGAAIATLFSQTIYCATLFILFINDPHQKAYRIKDFHFRLPLFRDCFKIGIPISMSRFTGFFFWSLIISIVAKKGDEYVTLISFGSTVFILTSIVRESLSSALTTLFSYFLGQNNWELIWKTFRSSIALLTIVFCLFIFPFHFYRENLINLIMGQNISSATTLMYLQSACYWLWIFFALEAMTASCVTLMTALKKTAYLLKTNILINFFASYLPYYFSFKILDLNPDKIWVINWIYFTFSILIYFLKAAQFRRENEKSLLKRKYFI